MPLEVEIFRNRHSLYIGHALYRQHGEYFATRLGMDQASTWYTKAQDLIEQRMEALSEVAINGEHGQVIVPSELTPEQMELLQLYMDYQDHWQHVSLVLERDEVAGTATTLLINRPMSMKLNDNLGQLVLNGAYVTGMDGVLQPSEMDFARFMKAFQNECAVYIGGPDEQEEPATLIHGIADLEGALEIAPGTGIYCGGLDAAIDGVLQGRYRPLDFRFFIGKHLYEDFALDLAVLQGKQQPVACARVLALKQCLSLPKPLWLEVMEYCGGDLTRIAHLENENGANLRFEYFEEDDDDEEDDDLEIDELDELYRLDDEDDDF
jgi:hypothetical protein